MSKETGLENVFEIEDFEEDLEEEIFAEPDVPVAASAATDIMGSLSYDEKQLEEKIAACGNINPVLAAGRYDATLRAFMLTQTQKEKEPIAKFLFCVDGDDTIYEHAILIMRTWPSGNARSLDMFEWLRKLAPDVPNLKSLADPAMAAKHLSGKKFKLGTTVRKYVDKSGTERTSNNFFCNGLVV